MQESSGPPSLQSSASPTPSVAPSNDDIEAVIQMATSARPSPDGRPGGPLRDTRTQLFVGNVCQDAAIFFAQWLNLTSQLPYRVRWQDLKDLFRKAGTVLRADVSLGPDNRSRGYGTVLLASAEDAGRAVDMFNGYSWQTRVLEVRADRLPPDFDSPLGSVVNSPGHNLTIGSGGISKAPSPLGLSSTINPLLAIPTVGDDFESTYGQDRPPMASSNSGIRNLFVGNVRFLCRTYI